MNEVSQKYKDLVGTTIEMRGPIFSYRKDKEFLTPTKFEVLKVRQGSGYVVDTETYEPKHSTVQLLLKREGMKRAQWCKPMPDYGTDLTKES